MIAWRQLACSLIALACAFTPLRMMAASTSLTFTYKHFLFTIPVTAHPEWRHVEKHWTFLGVPAVPPASLTAAGASAALPPGWDVRPALTWNDAAILQTIDRDIAREFERPAGTVMIARSASGVITFEGRGLTGRHIDRDELLVLTKVALESDVEFVTLPVAETQPQITVTDPSLSAQGIREVVAIGESSFARSPPNRRHNIGVGISRFNGHAIPRGQVFSFDAALGQVNERTGYRKELVILGSETLPDYGGGLCQVSSTAYRGPWEAGLPILKRRNHSYTVSYYSPQGTDATIYPPHVDFQFRNDTPGDLLIQTFTDDTDHAYFVYYGTKDERLSEVFGPYKWDTIPAPTEERYVYTSEIPPGDVRKAGERHDGVKVLWYRSVTTASGSTIERVFSSYEARPLTYQVGVAPGDMRIATGGTLSVPPSWLPRTR